MTPRQYENTVRDLLLLASPPVELVEWMGSEVPSLAAQAYAEMATTLAAAFMADRGARDQVLPCFEDTGSCIERIVTELGLRAFRRPLNDAESHELVRSYEQRDELTVGGTFEQAVESIVQQLLASPSFFMREELSNNQLPSGHFLLNDYEIASRLSYLLWESMPDAELFAQAGAGALQTRDAVYMQAQRMLGDPRALRMMRGFHARYAQLDSGRYQSVSKDPERFPAFSDEVADAMREEMARVFNEVTSSGGTFQDLLTTPVGFLNAALAPLYGVDASAYGSELTRVELPPDVRPGVFTRVGFLAAYASAERTSPIARGTFLARHVACLDPGPPSPQGVNTPLPTDPELVTNRQRVHAQTAGSACSGCHHALINPYGYPLEGFDATGAVQAVDNGAPVDTTANVAMEDGTPLVNGARELMQSLASYRGAWHCYAQQLVGHAFARQPSGEDLCLVGSLVDDIASGRPILELSARLALADSFRLRADEYLSQPPSPTPGPTDGEAPSSDTIGDGMTATGSDPSRTEPTTDAPGEGDTRSEVTDEDDAQSEAADEDNTDSQRPRALNEANPSPDAGSARFAEVELNTVDDASGASGCGCRTFATPTGTRQSSWALASTLALALIARRRKLAARGRQ